jgi:hypothetical protein
MGGRGRRDVLVARARSLHPSIASSPHRLISSSPHHPSSHPLAQSGFTSRAGGSLIDAAPSTRRLERS